MCGPVDVRIRRLGKIIFEEQVSYPVVESIVDAAFALKSVPLSKSSSVEEKLDKLIMTTQTCLYGVKTSFIRVEKGKVYNNERCIIKPVLTVDIYTKIDKLLAFFEIPVTTGQKELVKLLACIQRILVAECAGLDHEVFFGESALELVLFQHHDAGFIIEG